MRTLLIVSLFVLGCGSAGRSGGVADAKSAAGDGASTADDSVTLNPGFGPGPWGASCECKVSADCKSGLACGVQDSVAAVIHHCADAAWPQHECKTDSDCGCGGKCETYTAGNDGWGERCRIACVTDAGCPGGFGSCQPDGACID